jgi:hypothetical protein
MVRAILGMHYNTFLDLVPQFENALYVAAKNKPRRERAVGGGKKGVLKDAQMKLFFLLFYIKTYPTFDVIGFLFGKHRSQCCTDVHTWLPLLEKILGHAVVLPERRLLSVEEFYERFPGVTDIFPDGTERRMERPQKPRRNRRMYSGKKKMHTRKHIIVADDRKRILMLSPAKPGRRHDKRIFDGRSIAEHTPSDVHIWGDSGFQGIGEKHPHVHVAKRGTKKRPHTEVEREENHFIASVRIVSEHAIGGMKRFRIMRDTLRNKIGFFDDRISSVCAGLWNLDLRYA